MATVQEHYDKHLGPIYSWMLGDISAAMEQARQDLRNWGLDDAANRGQLAIDLGAGPGVYAVPLAELGYEVLAIDSCRQLVDELCERGRGLPIRAVHGELTEFQSQCERPARAILCLGDTLTHLQSRAAVERLIDNVAGALSPDGQFVATFRDYVTAPLAGDARFIPVRSDEQTILACFLEYSPETVRVHDLVYRRSSKGWDLQVSSYPKLRLAPEWVAAACERAGLAATYSPGARGMVTLTARRAAP